MYKHFLLPTDGSKLSRKAADQAIALAKALHARLTGFHASPEYPIPVFADGVVFEPVAPEDYKAQCAKQAQRMLDAIAGKARAAQVPFSGVHVYASTPWEAILAAARRQRCDVIVMASRSGLGVSALLLGSGTQKVLTHSKLPVLVVR